MPPTDGRVGLLQIILDGTVLFGDLPGLLNVPPQVITAVSDHLSYVWCLAGLHSHQQNRVHHKKVNNCWKPLLVFGEGTGRFGETVWDVFQGTGVGKEYHDWEQGLDEAVHYLDALVPGGAWSSTPAWEAGRRAWLPCAAG